MTISYILIFKLIFLIIFIFLSIYLLYKEFIYIDKLNLINESGVNEAGNRFTIGLDKIFLVLIPAGMGYRSFYRDEHELRKIYQQLKENEQEIKNLKAENEELKAQKDKVLSISRKTINHTNDLIENNNKLFSLKEKKSELQSAIKKLNGFSEEKNQKLIETANLDKEIQAVETKIDEKYAKFEEIKNQLSKKSIISFDFDLQTFVDSLRKEELLAFSGLLLNSLVLSYVVSIILVLYGDYLIKRFDLENKYPKLAKFIQLRRKLQNYYLKISFAGIFLALLPQFYVDIVILYSKLLEIFS